MSHLPLTNYVKSFNPRTRMGCDITSIKQDAELAVSIHAPAWGATFCRAYGRGASGFQSTHPHGVRLKKGHRASIVRSFNPRTRMGCDIFGDLRDAMTEKFQSTHPHGVRLNEVVDCLILGRFQSTHPHGVRLEGACFYSVYKVSIHAPAWGATVRQAR